MSKIINPDDYAGNIVMTRIRLARNLKGYPFRVDNVSVAKDIVKKVNRALVRSDTFNLHYVSNLTPLQAEAMKERHLISKNLMENVKCGAVLINQDESISVMINEEDHLREQCFMKGLRLTEAYQRLDKIDDDIAKNVDIAFDNRLGYLTACPTNLGTGLRASVMMFLPALTESGEIADIIKEVKRLGLTVRGLYGEGSKAEGCIYQISNEVTLGVSESEILSSVEQTVLEICRAERDVAKVLFVKNDLKTMDKAKKSYGVLTNAVMLSYSEFMEHIANVKLGAMLGMINITDLSAIDDLIINVRPANVCMQYEGKKLNTISRDLYRAEIVGKKLLKIKE